MTETAQLPNQPYPGLHAWEDLSGLMTNGWELGDQFDYLRGYIAGNTAMILGRVRIGSDRVATTPLPDAYRPYGGSAATGPSASVRGVGSAEVEVWGSGRIALPHNSITQGSRAEHYEGELFVFTITYPRRAA